MPYCGDISGNNHEQNIFVVSSLLFLRYTVRLGRNGTNKTNIGSNTQNVSKSFFSCKTLWHFYGPPNSHTTLLSVVVSFWCVRFIPIVQISYRVFHRIPHKIGLFKFQVKWIRTNYLTIRTRWVILTQHSISNRAQKPRKNHKYLHEHTQF